MKAAFSALAPPFIVAAVMTLLFAADASNPEHEARLSITWAICYGLGLLATSHFAPRSLTFLGWAFLISGIIASLSFPILDYHYLPTPDSATVFMALTFGLYHLIYAACAWPRKGGEQEP
jgi:hypothetical protein